MNAPIFTRRSALGMATFLLAPPAFALALADEKPADLAGTWTWKWTDAEGEVHHHVLEVESAKGKFSARERFDDQEPVKVNDLEVKEKKVHFSVLRGDRRATYTGKLASADTINGTVMIAGESGQPMEFGWTADRKNVKP